MFRFCILLSTKETQKYPKGFSHDSRRFGNRDFDPEDEAHDDAVHLSDMRGSVPVTRMTDPLMFGAAWRIRSNLRIQ